MKLQQWAAAVKLQQRAAAVKLQQLAAVSYGRSHLCHRYNVFKLQEDRDQQLVGQVVQPQPRRRLSLNLGAVRAPAGTCGGDPWRYS